MKQRLLISINKCYADEFDVEAFWVTTVENFEVWKEKLSKSVISEDKEIYFGTNECISFDSYDDIIDSLRIKEISKSEAKTIIKLIGRTYGLIDLSALPENYEEINNESN